MGRTLVIAEAGSCHDNDISSAFRLIEAAKYCGADAVKFQFWSDSKKLAERRGMPENADKYEAYRMPVGWLRGLWEKCQEQRIDFLCTTYLIEDIKAVDKYVKMFKVSAFESQWREFISAHCKYEKPIIISVNEGHKRLSFCQDTNFLYCVSRYPTPLHEVSLRKMQPHDGFSDHTGDVLAGAAAVARGAPIVECHIRLARTSEQNPDYPHSQLAAECECPFAYYVRYIRKAEQMV